MANTISAEDLVRKIKIRKAMKNIPLSAFDASDVPDGLEKKKFARCKCSYLDELYDDVSAPNSHYVTCIDPLVRDEKISKEELDTLSVSTIIKGYDGSYDIDNSSQLEVKLEDTACELICSRLANLFGVKTQYVAPIKDNPYCAIIVDFLKNKEEIQNFKEFTGASPSSYLKGFNISSWISPIVDQVFYLTPDSFMNPQLAKENVDRVLEDFVRQYIFKKYIVHDSDLCSVNIGFVVTPDGKFDVAPAFDFSNCFDPGVRSPQGLGLEEDMVYLAKHWPKILEQVTKDFDMARAKTDEVRGIINRFAPDYFSAKDYYGLVENSTINVVNTAKDVLSGKYLDNECKQN